MTWSNYKNAADLLKYHFERHIFSDSHKNIAFKNFKIKYFNEN